MNDVTNKQTRNKEISHASQMDTFMKWISGFLSNKTLHNRTRFLNLLALPTIHITPPQAHPHTHTHYLHLILVIFSIRNKINIILNETKKEKLSAMNKCVHFANVCKHINTSKRIKNCIFFFLFLYIRM